VPKFEEVFRDMLGGRPLPGFTLWVLNASRAAKDHLALVLGAGLGLLGLVKLFSRTVRGRQILDRAKLTIPVLGPVVRKLAIARFTRTFGTLVGSGVPILQALTIVKETSGNVVVGRAVESIHTSVKEGDPIAQPLKASGVFPAIVAGMVDVGEQTGALPEMLMKIADAYDDEVDNAVAALTVLLEPILIVFLALVVGTIVIAMFLPLVDIMDNPEFTDRSAAE
jgi:type IV pilus assembly protein PilC